MPKYEVVDLPKTYEVVDLPEIGATETVPGAGSDRARSLPTRGDKIDAAAGAVPFALATTATLPFMGPAAPGFGSFVAAAATRAAMAGLGGATGSVVKSGVQTMAGTPGRPKDTATVINRTLEEGMGQAAWQGAGEIAGALLPAVVGGTKMVLNYAPKSVGGQRFYKAKWDEIQKANDALRIAKDDAAGKVMDTLGKHVEPHEIGEIGRDGFTLFKQKFLESEQAQFQTYEAALADAKIDYRDVAKDLIDLEKSRPKAKGGLKVLTEGDAKWEELVNSMRDGQKAKVVPNELLGTTVLPAPNAAEAGDAVLRARSAVSTRLHDIETEGLGLAEGYTKEYVDGLRSLKGKLDQKIRSAAFAKDPLLGAGYDKLMQFSGEHREVLKQAFVGMAQKNTGDLAKNLLSSHHPEWVDSFKMAVKEGAITPEQAVDVQRSALESLMLRTKDTGEKVMDLENFATRLEGTAAAGRRLFSDPKASNTVANLRDLSKIVKDLPKTAQQAGIPFTGEPTNRVMEMCISAFGYTTTGLVFLPRELYAGANYAITKGLTAVAANPAAWPKLMKSVKMAQSTGKWSPTAANLLLDAFQTAKVAGQMRQAFSPLASAHEPTPASR